MSIYKCTTQFMKKKLTCTIETSCGLLLDFTFSLLPSKSNHYPDFLKSFSCLYIITIYIQIIHYFSLSLNLIVISLLYYTAAYLQFVSRLHPCCM